MHYENPKVPEGINVTAEHPLKEFTQLLAGAVVVVVIAATVLALLAEQLVRYVPFEMEVGIAAKYPGKLPPGGAVTDYLQALADKLAVAQELPAAMRITVHYVDDNTVNAMATLGGNVVFFRGLVEKMPNENALAMVMAHEIAHIKHRHPIMALGRGVVVGLALAALTNFSGNTMAGTALSDAGLLTVLSFNRDQEAEADRTALAALARHYGHATGADAFFQSVKDLPGNKVAENTPTFLKTHPATQDRIEKLRTMAKQNGWAMDSPTVPVPEVIRTLVRKQKS